MFCDMCGNELSHGAAYCWNCGSAVNKNTQRMDTYNLSQFPHLASSPTLLNKERVTKAIASFEQFMQTLRTIQNTAHKNGDAANKQQAALQSLHTSYTTLVGTFTNLERNPAFRDAPTEEVRLSFEQMALTHQHYELAIQHVAAASQELDNSAETLIQALEMMITWLRNHT
jgi:hypothetical protein